MALYGYDTWQNAWWPTRDHVIPWKLFLVYCRGLARVRAGYQLEMAHAVTLGYVAARVPKEKAFRLRNSIRRLERFAAGEGDDE